MLKRQELKNPTGYFQVKNGDYIKGNPSIKSRNDWVAARGSLYYGKTDPDYIIAQERADTYNDLYSPEIIESFKNARQIKTIEGVKLTPKIKKQIKAQEKINMQALENFYNILNKRNKKGELLMPLNDSALLISQAYQGTTGLIKIAAPFVGVSQRFIRSKKGKRKDAAQPYIEEHSPPASAVGAAMFWGLENNQTKLIMQGIKDNFIQIQLSNSADRKIDIAGLDKIVPKGMNILTPNVGILRLAKAGINLNTIIDLETGKSLADKAGLPLPNEFKSNPSAVKYQNELLVDVALIPELTLEKAKENLKASLPTQENKNTQVKNNTKKFGSRIFK